MLVLRAGLVRYTDSCIYRFVYKEIIQGVVYLVFFLFICIWVACNLSVRPLSKRATVLNVAAKQLLRGTRPPSTSTRPRPRATSPRLREHAPKLSCLILKRGAFRRTPSTSSLTTRITCQSASCVVRRPAEPTKKQHQMTKHSEVTTDQHEAVRRVTDVTMRHPALAVLAATRKANVRRISFSTCRRPPYTRIRKYTRPLVFVYK
jgi:hypothetical protein